MNSNKKQRVGSSGNMNNSSDIGDHSTNINDSGSNNQSALLIKKASCKAYLLFPEQTILTCLSRWAPDSCH